MLSDIQLLADSGQTGWAGLTSAIGVDIQEEDTTLPAHPFQQREKLSKGCSTRSFRSIPLVNPLALRSSAKMV